MKSKLLLFLLPLSIFATKAPAQKSLLDELGKDEETIEYAKYSFKTNRIINLHSLENTAEGVLDFKISHRFAVIDEGIYDLFGLDAATLRIGFDYGITDNLTIGVNRNSVRCSEVFGLTTCDVPRCNRVSVGFRTDDND